MGQYLNRNRYSRQFIEHYLVPMGAAIWSAPPDRFLQFPARFIVNFFNNHGLLTVRGHPRWKPVEGGAVRYVEALEQEFLKSGGLREAMTRARIASRKNRRT